jgi:hypothetical protein
LGAIASLLKSELVANRIMLFDASVNNPGRVRGAKRAPE